MSLFTYDPIVKTYICCQNFTQGKKVTSFITRALPLLFSVLNFLVGNKPPRNYMNWHIISQYGVGAASCATVWETHVQKWHLEPCLKGIVSFKSKSWHHRLAPSVCVCLTILPPSSLIAKGNQVELKLHNFFGLPSFPASWGTLKKGNKLHSSYIMGNSLGELVLEGALLDSLWWTMEDDTKERILTQAHTRSQ